MTNSFQCGFADFDTGWAVVIGVIQMLIQTNLWVRNINSFTKPEAY